MASEIRSFHPNTDVIMACHITGVYDVNRTTTLDDDNYELVRDWAESVAEHQLQGILVEPQPLAAEVLRERYRLNPNVKVAEVAVASKNGLLQLWKVAQVTQIGKLKMDAVTSFDRSSLSVKLKKWGVKAELEPISVKAMSLQEILEEHQMVSPDIVVIDTEGMDRIVLDQVEFSEKGPALIQFEINNLNSKDLEYCRQRLIRSGYKFILTERDAICIHPAYLRYLVG
jgi:FkbM family methyltransferase